MNIFFPKLIFYQSGDKEVEIKTFQNSNFFQHFFQERERENKNHVLMLFHVKWKYPHFCEFFSFSISIIFHHLSEKKLSRCQSFYFTWIWNIQIFLKTIFVIHSHFILWKFTFHYHNYIIKVFLNNEWRSILNTTVHDIRVHIWLDFNNYY